MASGRPPIAPPTGTGFLAEHEQGGQVGGDHGAERTREGGEPEHGSDRTPQGAGLGTQQVADGDLVARLAHGHARGAQHARQEQDAAERDQHAADRRLPRLGRDGNLRRTEIDDLDDAVHLLQGRDVVGDVVFGAVRRSHLEHAQRLAARAQRHGLAE